MKDILLFTSFFYLIADSFKNNLKLKKSSYSVILGLSSIILITILLLTQEFRVFDFNIRSVSFDSSLFNLKENVKYYFVILILWSYLIYEYSSRVFNEKISFFYTGVHLLYFITNSVHTYLMILLMSFILNYENTKRNNINLKFISIVLATILSLISLSSLKYYFSEDLVFYSKIISYFVFAFIIMFFHLIMEKKNKCEFGISLLVVNFILIFAKIKPTNLQLLNYYMYSLILGVCLRIIYNLLKRDIFTKLEIFSFFIIFLTMIYPEYIYLYIASYLVVHNLKLLPISMISTLVTEKTYYNFLKNHKMQLLLIAVSIFTFSISFINLISFSNQWLVLITSLGLWFVFSDYLKSLFLINKKIDVSIYFISSILLTYSLYILGISWS